VNQVSVDVVGSKWGSQIRRSAGGPDRLPDRRHPLHGLPARAKMSGAGIIALLHDSLSRRASIHRRVRGHPGDRGRDPHILGYSLYDTWWSSDKNQRERHPAVQRRKSYRQIANDAMNQTLMRSINTSLSTLIPVGSLLFVGSFLSRRHPAGPGLALFVGIAPHLLVIFVATRCCRS